jgi:hypothetical protein
MSTPERQQDPGEHGFGGVEQDPATDADRDDSPGDPLEAPDNDSGREPDDEQDRT